MSDKIDMAGDGYTTTPTHVRVWQDGDEWFVDGADDDGRYTEACWSYDSFAEAIANVQDFIDRAPTYGMTFEFSAARPRGFYWRKTQGA